MATLSTFFAGRGHTREILIANILTTVVNGTLDYFWIFGRAGFPRGGVAAAAWGTVIAQVCGSAFYLALILRREFRSTYRTLAGWRFEPALFLRLLRFGLPSGLQFSTEVGAFALFMIIVGRIGTVPLAASGISLNLNMIVFMPMLGLGVGVSSLVGRCQGAGLPDLAERSTWTAFRISLVYMSACGALYLFLPHLLLAPYAAGSDPGTFSSVETLAAVLLRFVAIYSIFDMMNVIFAAGLKGAGDTRYPLAASAILACCAMLAPAYIACVHFGAGVYAAWTTASAYVFFLGILMLRRFRAGRWKGLLVIERPLPSFGELNPAGPA
jgi:MATE family multidrug resistance protein